jgi:signal transduction histidine kinase
MKGLEMTRADSTRPEQRETGDTAGSGNKANLFAGTAFLAAMTLLILLGLLGYRTFAELRGATDRVTRTYQVIEKLQELLTDLSDAETGQRDFIITGDRQYLEPYIAALGELDRDMAAVKSLTADNPGQQERLPRIEAAARERLAILKAGIEARKTTGFRAAREIILSGRGKMLMDSVRSRITETVEVETGLLQERSALLPRKTTKANQVLLAGSLLAVTLLGAVFIVLKKEITRRGRVESELDRQRKQLYVALEERTRAADELTRQRRSLEEMNDRLKAEVAERIQAQELLKGSNAELERSNRELELFASVASHDLQEPLHTIASYTELLAHKYKGRLDEKADKYIDFITVGTGHMHTMINDLLAYSRVGTRAKPFVPVKTDSVLDQALAALGKSLKESGTVIERDELPEVAGDDTQLAQLFQNLIGNAIKFRKKEAPLTIRVSCERRDDEWVFCVRDNGIGIEPRFFDRIFEIFRRLHTREEYEGSGMGLAICRKIVERHGGSIWVESTFGEGSSFCFTLPERGAGHGA